MKILFCAYDRPGHIATGPNAWIQRLVFELKTKYSLDVITLFFYTGDLCDCPSINYFKLNELKVETYCTSKHPYIEDQVRFLLTTVQKMQIQLVVANLTVPGYYAAKYLAEHNIPCIPVFHSNDTFTKGVFKKFIISKDGNYFRTTVSVSEYINKLSQSTNGCVIPCGTPLTGAQTSPPEQRLKIIYAGRLVVEAKQIIKLTQAFISASKQNPHLEFNIIGDGIYRDEVKTYISNNNSEKVKLHPAVAPTEIIRKISEHHVITLLSDYEGMPIAVMEAMSVGVVPVCYIGEGGISELIQDGVNGFIVKDREKDYQDKLRLLQEDPELWKRMSIEAIKTIEEKFSTEITHKKWADLLLSYKNDVNSKLIIPKKIVLEGEPLLYGDNRRPAFIQRVRINCAKQWMEFRLAIRPRARLRAFFQQK